MQSIRLALALWLALLAGSAVWQQVPEEPGPQMPDPCELAPTLPFCP